MSKAVFDKIKDGLEEAIEYARRPVRSPESILARVKANGISKRYILRASSAKRWEAGVYDQKHNRFIPDDEIERIDPDERMTLR